MTETQFIEHIVNYYRESGNLSIDPKPYNIWRGVNHSVSSKAEDLFALFVAKRLNDNSLEFIVDKTISMRKKGEKTVQFRPDLAIIKNGLITHIFDLKMDMGYKRRYHETENFNSIKRIFKRLREQDFDNLFYKRNNKHVNVQIVKNIVNQIVVISEKNEGKEVNRTDMVKSISNLDWVKIYYLSGEVHPNKVKDTMPTIRENNFKNLFKDIKKIINDTTGTRKIPLGSRQGASRNH